MIALRMRVPVASWRKGRAREYVETEPVPPPATCYGALLSLVGELERERHIGARVTGGLLNSPSLSTVIRTFWQIKQQAIRQGVGVNAGPDFQELLTDIDLVVLCDSGQEDNRRPSLEDRVHVALERPAAVNRFGGWALGESTHLVNDVWQLPDGPLPRPCRTFLAADRGRLTLPVWVDHVGFARTRYAVGDLVEIEAIPDASRVPRIEPSDD